MSAPRLVFPDGYRMPQVGLGTWQVRDADDLTSSLKHAEQNGYRLIDTAFAYKNERIIGDYLKQEIAKGELKRDKIFVTSKLQSQFMANRERVLRGFYKSFDALQLEYIDLYLIHNPVSVKLAEDGDGCILGDDGRLVPEDVDPVTVWKVLEELVDEGKVRSLGLSNFNSEQISRIQAVAMHPICNLQIECHLYLQQRKLREFCQARVITVTAFSPLGSPGKMASMHSVSNQPLKDQTVAEIAKVHARSPAQILLRFLVEEGIAIVPKSVNPSRIKENIEIFDFTLTADEVAQLRSLDKNHRFFQFDLFANGAEYPLSIGY